MSRAGGGAACKRVSGSWARSGMQAQKKKQHEWQGKFLHAIADISAMKEETTRAARHYSIWVEPVSSSSPSTEMRRERRKCRSLGVKGPPSATFFRACFGVFGILGADLVEADGGLQHQQHIEAVAADVLDDPGDLLALDDRLMDGLAQLLNEFAQAGCHGYLQCGGQREKGAGAAWDLSTLLPQLSKGNWQPPLRCGKATTQPPLVPSYRNETGNHRTGAGRRAARGGAHGGPAHGRVTTASGPRPPAPHGPRGKLRSR